MTLNKKQPKPLLDRVRAYLSRGWQPIPVEPRSKKPSHKNWTALRLSEEEVGEYFSEGDNVGLLLGEPSGGLVDIDLDTLEAIALASAFLPETSRRHGRASRPASHWWYLADPIPEAIKFKDVDGACMAELRSTGGQTLVPPSIHPTGERMFWEEAAEPARVDGDKLCRRTARLAACVLVARHWPTAGTRHDTAMALAGMLLRNRSPETWVTKFISLAAKCARDEEWRLRANDVKTTAQRIAEGRTATGIPTLAELLGPDVVQRLEDWLQLERLTEDGHHFARVAPWPDPLDSAALNGLAGDFVRAIEPNSEADPVALLSQFLVEFGNIAGRKPFFTAEADKHHNNLNVTLVGVSSKARKGSSWSHVRKIGRGIDGRWAADKIQQGLSSGEGLIWAVRDRIEKLEPVREKGRVVKYQHVIADEGVEDKRLLVVEPEFASVLRNLARDGNTLSPTMRQAWDTGLLHILTKNSPAKASGAHISVIAHVTRDELRRYLNSTEIGNGFANRFIWLCTRRSKSLPEGGHVDEAEFRGLIDRARDAVEFARGVGELRRSEKARRLWFEVYQDLSEGKPGLLGSVTSRGEAQVMRLACIYALLDRSQVVKEAHLRAALALWKYSEQSARFIFGDSLGDPLADGLLKALRKNADGLTRTQIRDLFDRNRSAGDIERALAVLVENGLAEQRIEETGERGRPSERWMAVGVRATTITTKKPPPK